VNMDDQVQELIAFHRELTSFNTRLNGSVNELERSHDSVNAVWQDDMRRAYDAQYGPLQTNITRYVRLEGPRYLDFLQLKIRYAQRYLNGG
jgi:uncharacterized protein YukE